MRYYGFCNFMLSSIQQGVQNFHVLGDMMVTYTTGERAEAYRARSVLHQWATEHKTAIFLNGGNAAGIRDVYEHLCRFGQELNLPYDKFHEDQDSLDSMMTACGIVVPTYIVDMMTVVRSTPDWTEYEQKYPGPIHPTALDLALYLNQFQLAR